MISFRSIKEFRERAKNKKLIIEDEPIDKKEIIKTGEQARKEEEEEERKIKEECTCPECGHSSQANHSGYMFNDDRKGNFYGMTVYKLYKCTQCRCEWRVIDKQ